RDPNDDTADSSPDGRLQPLDERTPVRGRRARAGSRASPRPGRVLRFDPPDPESCGGRRLHLAAPLRPAAGCGRIAPRSRRYPAADVPAPGDGRITGGPP